MSPLARKIEALLFATAETWSISALASRLEVTDEAITGALDELADILKEHAFGLVRNEYTVVLATNAEHTDLLAAVRKEELSKDLSKASAEVLAIITYKPGATKTEIEFIRGVNSSYSLRALQIRGLVEQSGIGRAIGYQPTLALLEQYGVTSVQSLPLYLETVQKLEAVLNQAE